MYTKKLHNRKYMICLILISFFILSGFEFETLQDELNSAENLIRENKYSQAEERLNSVMNNLKTVNESGSEIEKMAKNLLTPQVYYKLGEIQYKQNKYENALIYFNNVINFEIRSMWDVKAIYYSGMSYFYLNKYTEARGSFSRLANEYKDSGEAAEGQYYVGLCYELEGNTEQANASFIKFLDIYPNHPWAEKVKMELKGK